MKVQFEFQPLIDITRRARRSLLFHFDSVFGVVFFSLLINFCKETKKLFYFNSNTAEKRWIKTPADCAIFERYRPIRTLILKTLNSLFFSTHSNKLTEQNKSFYANFCAH